jgi:calcineurin-like phosphoesterase family protein/thymidylate kinase
MIFYTSDIHFSDEKIRVVCGRPFDSVEIMNQTIIRNWNTKVGKTDTVYILGDIFPCAGGDPETVIVLTEKLNGHKILIAGNHDEEFLPIIERKEVFERINHIAVIQDSGREIVLCHYPLMSWKNDDNGSIHLYGHIHNKDLSEILNYYIDKKAFNVGLDVRNFIPVTLTELLGRNVMHISIEGFDGVGKTTAARSLARQLGFTLVEKPLKYLFDPDGGDENYLRIRDYVNSVSPHNRPFSACFYGLGNIFIYEKFKGQNIITDRHLLSNYAWSGSHESKPIFEALYKVIGAPDFTFIIYGDSGTIHERLVNRDRQDSDLKKLSQTEEVYSKMVDFADEYQMPYYLIDTKDKTPEMIVKIMTEELTRRGLING